MIYKNVDIEVRWEIYAKRPAGYRFWQRPKIELEIVPDSGEKLAPVVLGPGDSLTLQRHLHFDHGV